MQLQPSSALWGQSISYGTGRSYCVGMNGAVIVFNEGTTLSLQHWASSPVRIEQLAFTCLKYHTYQLPLPCSLQTSTVRERQWRKTQRGTAYPLSYRSEQYRGYCGVAQTKMKYLLLRLNVQCREGFKNKSKVTYSKHTRTHTPDRVRFSGERKEISERAQSVAQRSTCTGYFAHTHAFARTHRAH